MRKLFKSSIVLIAFAFSGCATNTGNPSTDARGRAVNEVGKQLFNAALNFGLNEGKQYFLGQNGQDAAAGAFEAAKGSMSSFDIGRIVSAYAGPEVGAVAQEQLDTATAKVAANPKEAKYFGNVIGAAFQLAANQLTK